MKLLTHDAYRTFDYCAFVNAVFDKMMMADKTFDEMSVEVGLSFSNVSKFFRYERVSLPTIIMLADYAQVNLSDFLIWQD